MSKLRDDWADFTDRTAIHGFAEYGGAKRALGVVGRVLWCIIIAGVAAFCIWQLYVLFAGFIQRDPVTSVATEGDFDFPVVSFRLESNAKVQVDVINRTLITAAQNEYDKTTTIAATTTPAVTTTTVPAAEFGMGGGGDGGDFLMPGTGDPGAMPTVGTPAPAGLPGLGATPAMPGWDNNQDTVVKYQEMILYPTAFRSYGQGPDLAAKGIAQGNGCPAVNPNLAPGKKPFFELVKNEGGFEQYYKKIMPSALSSQSLPGTIVDIGSGIIKGPNLTGTFLQMHIEGPQYVIPLANLGHKPFGARTVTFRINRVYDTLKEKFESSDFYAGRYFLNMGNAAKNLDTLESGQAFTNGYDYQVAVSLTRYSRTSVYCDKEMDTLGLGCSSLCRLRDAKKFGGCLPALLGIPHNIRACEPTKEDHDACAAVHTRCEAYCKSCKSCQSCEETMAEITIEQVAPLQHGNWSKEFRVQAKFTQSKMQHFSMREQYTTVAFLSQLGGIMGLCFGVSIVAIFHAVMALLSTPRHLCDRKKVADEAAPAREAMTS